MNDRSCVATSSRLGKTFVAALFAFGALAAVPGTPAQAHESEHESTSVETRAQPAKVKAGAKCNKKGKKKGKFTCKRSKGKLVWVRTGGKTAQQGVVFDALCSTSTYTSQVRGLRCSSMSITFGYGFAERWHANDDRHYCDQPAVSPHSQLHAEFFQGRTGIIHDSQPWYGRNWSCS